MHTHSSPPQSTSGDTTAISTGTLQVDWSEQDKKELINFLLDHKAEAGNLATFKSAVWNAATLNSFGRKEDQRQQVHALLSGLRYVAQLVMTIHSWQF